VLLLGVAGGCWVRGRWLARAAAAAARGGDEAPSAAVLAAVAAAVKERDGKLVARHGELLEKHGELAERHVALAGMHEALAAQLAALHERARAAEDRSEALHVRAAAAEGDMAAAHERAAAAQAAAAAAAEAAHTAAGVLAVRLARSTRLSLPEAPAGGDGAPFSFFGSNPLHAAGAAAGARGAVTPAPGLYTHSGETLAAHRDAPLSPPRLATPAPHPMAPIDSLRAAARGARPTPRLPGGEGNP
jgi:hypothetical protein